MKIFLKTRRSILEMGRNRKLKWSDPSVLAVMKFKLHRALSVRSYKVLYFLFMYLIIF